MVFLSQIPGHPWLFPNYCPLKCWHPKLKLYFPLGISNVKCNVFCLCLSVFCGPIQSDAVKRYMFHFKYLFNINLTCFVFLFTTIFLMIEYLVFTSFQMVQHQSSLVQSSRMNFSYNAVKWLEQLKRSGGAI